MSPLGHDGFRGLLLETAPRWVVGTGWRGHRLGFPVGVCERDSLQVTTALSLARRPWCRRVPLARASPPPPWPAGSRAAEVPGAQERPRGRAPPPPGPAGRTPAFPISCLARRPLPRFLSPPRGWLLPGAWKAVGAPGPPRTALRALLSARHREGAGAAGKHSTQHRGS